MTPILSIFRAPLRSALVAAALLGAAGASSALDITLPPETAAFRPSDMPGYALVQRNCVACHAAQYASSQPPASPRSYWDATVKKMKSTFGAQFPDEDIPAMVDYLSKTYGAEHTAGSEKMASDTSAPAASGSMVNSMGGASVAAADAPKAAPAQASATPADAQALLVSNNCTACHAVDQKVVGPAFKEVAAKYAGKPDALTQVAANIRAGGSGKWGPVPMPPFPQLSKPDAEALAKYVLSR